MALPLVLAGAQGALGLVQSITGGMKADRVKSQMRSFQTPDEAYKILNATQSMASTGFDAFTLGVMKDNINKTTSATLGTAMRLGADPNDLSSILDTQINNIIQLGAENADRSMQNFSKYLGALDMMKGSKEAEWASEQNMLKDQMQAATADKAAGLQNLGSAANMLLSNYAAERADRLFKEKNPTTK